MTTKKPSTVTSATGAYAYKSGVSSTATNYIDNTFPNLLDKTGDNLSNGGGISGRIDLLNGSTLEVQPGATISYNGGGTLVFNGTSGITMNDSSTLQLNNSATMLMGASSFLLCGGTLNITSGGTFNLNNTGNMHIKNGATMTVDSGGTVAFASGAIGTATGSATFSFNSGAILNINSGAYLDLNSSSTVIGTGTLIDLTGASTLILANGGGSFLTIGTGNTLNVHGTHNTDVWPNWNTPQTRQLVESTVGGYPLSGSWTGAPQFVYDNGTGGVWTMQIRRSHHGATLAQLFIGLSVGQSHAAVPANRPNVSVIRYAWNGMFNPQTLSTVDPQYFPNPGSGAAYYNSGNQQYLNYVCNQNNVIDNENYIYAIIITDESGANSLSLNAFGLVTLEYQVISNQKWSM